MPRQRATAIVFRDDKVLLVRNRGSKRFSLPGGRIGRGELPISAAARELHEETGLEAGKIEFLFNFQGKGRQHQVCRVDAKGEVMPDNEIEDFVWWDPEQNVPLVGHVRRILRKLKRLEESESAGELI